MARTRAEEEYATFGRPAPPARIDPPGAPRDVAGLIARAAAHCPDAEALVDSRRSHNFRELAEAVTAAAALFDGAGVGAGDRVAASLGNQNDLVIAFFAALRLGAVLVGIRSAEPPSALQSLMRLSNAVFCLQ